MKSSATIRFKKNNVVEKVYLNSKQIALENEKFSFKATCFIPKADLKKPQPKMCLTIDISDDKARLVSAYPEDILNALIDLTSWFQEVVNSAEPVLEKERDRYIEAMKEQAIAQRRKKDVKVIELNTMAK